MIYDVLPETSVDVRINKAYRRIKSYKKKIAEAVAEGSNQKKWFYLNLIHIQKQKIEHYRQLKAWGMEDMFLQQDVKKKLGITY